jgi:uncharacterized protein YjaZ
MTEMETPQSRSPATFAIPPMAGVTSSRPAMDLRKPQSDISALSFTQLPGAAVFVAAAPDGTFWVLSTVGLPTGDKFIYHYTGGTFVNVPGAATRLAVGPDNSVWALNAAGGIYHLVNGSFTGIAGGASEISISADNSVYVISNQPGSPVGRGIYRYANGTWSQLPGAGVTVAASIDSNSYTNILGVNNSLINVTAGGFYVTNAQGGIYYYNLTTGFVQLPGGAISLAPTASGGLFALGDPGAYQHGIYYNNLSTGQWSSMPGAAVSLATNGSTVYAIGAAGGIYSSPITASTLPANVALSGTNTLTGSIPAKTASATLSLVSTSMATPTTPVNVSIGITGATGNAIERSTAEFVRASATPAMSLGDPYGPRDDRATNYQFKRLPGAVVVSNVRRAQSLPALGTQQNFWLAVFPIGQSVSSYQSVGFTLMSASPHVAVWIQTAIAASYASRAAALANDAETALTSDIAYAGPASYDNTAAGLSQRYGYCDASQNSSGSGQLYIAPPSYINLLLVDPSQLGAGVGGDFSPTDYYVQSAANCFGAKSNEQPTVTLGLLSSYTNLDYYVRQTAAHEFTHLIQFVNQNVIAGKIGTAPGVIQEGLAELSRDAVLGHPDYGNVAQNSGNYFLPAPQNYSILGMMGNESGSFSAYTYGNYGAAYLLMRYTADRYGIGFVKTYMQNDPEISKQQSLNALAASAGSSSFAQLFGDFGSMLAANANGLPAFAPYAINSFSLTGTYSAPSAFSTSYTYYLPGVAVAATYPQNATVPIYPGGISIVGTSGVVSGGSVAARDLTAALSLEGSISAR